MNETKRSNRKEQDLHLIEKEPNDVKVLNLVACGRLHVFQNPYRWCVEPLHFAFRHKACILNGWIRNLSL